MLTIHEVFMFDSAVLESQISEAEAQIKDSQSKREEKQAKMESLYSSLSEKNFSIEDSENFDLDFENASLSNVKDAENALNNNMVRLINSLDSTTNELGNEFTTMRQLTAKEKFIGIFSKTKASEMRSERISEASVESNLQDILTQSNSITALLQSQLESLNNEVEIGRKNLTHTLELREKATVELDGVRTEISNLSPQIEDLQLKRSNEEDATSRTKLDGELNTLIQEENELKDKEAVLLNQSMTLERYIKLNESNVDSLNNQITSQKVMIGKLKTDTQQREIIYKSLEVSLKTAEQQETAHAINKIGTETDKVVQNMHASIGASTSNALAEMMEDHKGNMQSANDVLKAKAEADDMFYSRFGAVSEEHDSESYSK
jgi:peptidoglycan hydrolase CwlO-like protein